MNENEERELGWEDEITKDSEEFPQLEPGDYSFTVDHFEKSRSQGSDKLPPTNMAILYLNVHDDKTGETVQLRDFLVLHTKMEWKISQFFCGIGLKKEGETLKMNWNAIPGLTGRCEITLDPDKEDPSKKYNHIKKYYPKSANGFKKGSF